MSIVHGHIMPAAQAELLRSLGPLAHGLGYYLAGGTAVGLRLGHRQSIDFDWFADNPRVQPPDVPGVLTNSGLRFDVKNLADRLVDGFINGIRTTFIQYPYPTLEPLEPWDEYNFALAGLTDLTCMKLWAIANRGSRKDFIDIYAILDHGISLGESLEAYRQKFGVQDTMPVLYGLAYFDEAERQPMPRMLIQADWSHMKSAIQNWTRQASR